MIYLDKKNKEGSPLSVDAIKLNEEISNYCFNKTKKTRIYKELSKHFNNDYLEIFFKRHYCIEALEMSHNITLNKWSKKNSPNQSLAEININLFQGKEYLKEFLTFNNIEFIDRIDKKFTKIKINNIYKFFKRFIKIILSKFKKKKDRNNNNDPKIAVAYNEGIDLDKRSDLFWLENSEIEPNEVLLYFEYKGQFTRHGTKENLFKKINKLNIRHINLWEYEFNSEIPFLNELKKKLKNSNFYHADEFFLKKIILELIEKFKYWYVFFKRFNIKVHMDAKDFGFDSIIKYLALNKLNGCTVGKMRSHIEQIRGDNVPPINASDIFFVPNKDSAYRLKNYTSNRFQSIVVSGFPYNPNTENNILEINKIKNFFKDNNKNFIVLFCDTEHRDNKNNYFQSIMSKSLYNFYNSFINALSKDDEIGIIIKNKRLQGLKNLDDMYDKILEHQKNGLCYLIDDPFQRMPLLYSSISNFVVAVCHCYPSALMECVLNAQKGSFCDLNNLKYVEKEWYKWGENKVIFNDPLKMSEQILNLKKNFQTSNQFGIWSDREDLLDPYKDNLGSERIGKYLNFLLKCLKNEKSKDKAITSTNEEFVKNWGKDKII